MIDFFVGIFLATLIVALFTTRLYRLLLWYSLNSLSLGILALILGKSLDDKALLITGIATVVLKAFIIPYVLKNIIQKISIPRQIAPNIKIQHSILLVPAIIVFTFYLTDPLINIIKSNANYVAISISALFLSLILMLEHKNIAPKIIGFLSMENSLFLLGISTTDGMPMLVELGIFFDLLMAIVVINLLFKKEEISV
jgi:hydrogenase-4 component E